MSKSPNESPEPRPPIDYSEPMSYINRDLGRLNDALASCDYHKALTLLVKMGENLEDAKRLVRKAKEEREKT